VAVIAVALIVALCCITTVPTGYTGIVTTFGRVEDHTFDAGFHIKSPFQRVIKMDNRTQKAVETLQAFSSDIQQVDISIAVNYSIDQTTAEKLYKTVGEEYYSKILYPRLLENTKSIFSKYTAEKLVAYREKLSTEITELVTEDVKDYGITVSSISVQDIDFTDAFTNAVEAKQVAQQNKLTAQTQQDQLTMEAEQEAQRQVIKAQADAEQAKIAAQADLEVTKIQADAAEYAGQKEAAKNKAISESLTEELVRYYYIQQWNGELPSTMLGESASILYGLN
jgi:regulator of protease activity HflC (stomatin/prohibitin superfamily)